MTYVSRAFNPTYFLKDPSEFEAHEEIIAWIKERQNLL